MARWLTLILALLMIALGVVFSAINAEPAALDLYYTSISIPTGVLVLASVFFGCILGGAFLYAGVIVPLRMRVRARTKELQQHRTAVQAQASSA